VQPAVETALGRHKREALKCFDLLEGLAPIPTELLAGEDGDSKHFPVWDFGVWGVAMVEYFEQVVEEAKGCDDLVQPSSPPCTRGYCTCTSGEDLTKWHIGLV
jgi:hypothetical protein